ncbi:MAG: helix-turn-helix domain-containing protein [Candidatus Omnitrophica bacterium]|nr:helix-turn-helix domain-containing protein [Candidatus Omnitrophota bacterium]
MGVVHKLKQEIIDFILNYKKERPNTSCRELASVASDKFTISLSKSSVNKILKEFELSNSVGRPFKDLPTGKKFAIPMPTKKKLYDNLIKSGYILAVEDTSSSQIENKEVVMGNQGHDNNKNAASSSIYPSEERNDEEITIAEKPEAHVLKPAGGNDSLPRLEGNSPSSGFLCRNLGLIVLKSLEWHIFRRNFLGSLFRSFLKEELPNNFDNACEALFAQETLGLETFPDEIADSPDAIWLLHGLKNEEGRKAASECFKSLAHISDISLIALTLKNEIDLALTQVQGFNLQLADGTGLLVDAQTASIWMGTIPSSGWNVMEKAFSYAAESLASNNSPLILCRSPEKMSLLYEFIGACENLNNTYIKSVTSLGVKGDILADIAEILPLRRKFIVGLCPEAPIFDACTKAAKWIPKISHQISFLEKEIFYNQTKTEAIAGYLSGFTYPYRVLAIWGKKDGEIITALLTNDFISSPEEIIEAYASRWPDFDKNFYGQYFSIPGTKCSFSEEKVSYESLTEVNNIWDIFTLYRIVLEGFISNITGIDNRCDINKFFTEVYKMPGYLFHSADFLSAEFLLPEDFEFNKEIIDIITFLNNSNIRDLESRKVLSKISLQ